MKKASIQLEGLACPSCMQKIERAVKNLDGVSKETVKVLFNSGKVKLEFDEDMVSAEQVVDAIESMGYEVVDTIVK